MKFNTLEIFVLYTYNYLVSVGEIKSAIKQDNSYIFVQKDAAEVYAELHSTVEF